MSQNTMDWDRLLTGNSLGRVEEGTPLRSGLACSGFRVRRAATHFDYRRCHLRLERRRFLAAKVIVTGGPATRVPSSEKRSSDRRPHTSQ
jgi:hypothetical protein